MLILSQYHIFESYKINIYSVFSLAGRYDNAAVPELTLSPQSGTMNSATAGAQGPCQRWGEKRCGIIPPSPPADILPPVQTM